MTAIRTIYLGNQQSRIGIIFVHGIDGDDRTTWTEPTGNQCWIEWLSDVGATIFTFAYEAYKKDLANIFSLDEIAEHLSQQLSHHSEIETWIFICHSLGGLVAKRAFLEANKIRVQRAHFVFFGTPQRGARFRFLPGFVRAWAHRDHTVTTLVANERYLNALNDEFLNIAPGKGTKVLSFYEVRRWFGLQIVSKSETILGPPYDSSIAIYADHERICKFATREDSGFLLTKEFVEEIIRTNQRFRVRPYTRPNF